VDFYSLFLGCSTLAILLFRAGWLGNKKFLSLLGLLHSDLIRDLLLIIGSGVIH
jgi:hypothetical protein